MYKIECSSSLISFVEYDDSSNTMIVHFKKYYVDEITYKDVPKETFIDFATSSSVGKFYLRNIKPHFLTSLNPQKMADKVIKIKIDVKKINKDYLWVGEKGVYLNCTLLYNEEEDAYGNCGMVVQDVPTEIYKKDKAVKGNILGNGKEFAKGGANKELTPGSDAGLKQGVTDDVADDLPF
jgi:hypothetical protein